MRKNYWLWTLAVALCLSFLWGFGEYRESEKLKIVTENHFRRSFADFVSHIDSLETNLAKSRAAGTPTQQIFYLSQSWQQSETAVKNLALMPVKEIGLSYVDQFLNQVGEYTRNLTQQLAKGAELNTGQQRTLGEMHERLISVNRNIQELNVTLSVENIPLEDKASTAANWPVSNNTVPASAEGNEEAAKPGSVGSGLEQLDASLQKLPPFTYEGQADTQSVPEPLGLPKKTADQEEAKLIAADFLRTIGYQSPDPKLEHTSTGPFGGYIWQYENTIVDVSKSGGVVTLFRDERPLEGRILKPEDAVNQAMSLMTELGWNVIMTSMEDFGTYLHIEAVCEEKGIRIYPDKLRLAVALDNGRIVGYDSTSYWLFHHERSLEQESVITPEQARKSLRPDLGVKESRLTVITRPGWGEILAYEFRGTINSEEFLVYINALDGSEEKIQRVIITPRGEFLQ